MNEKDFVPNSYKYKEEKKQQTTDVQPRAQKVVSGVVKKKKKSEIRKFTDVFVSEDVHNVKSYIWMDVLVPAMKKAIADVVTNGIDMLLYGETGRTKRGTPSSKVSYGSYYKREDDRRNYDSGRSRYSYDDIVLESRGEAEEVLSQMDAIMEEYGMVRVADLYDLVGITGEHTDNKYGWTNIRNAEVQRVRDGYMIKMPRAIPIK